MIHPELLSRLCHARDLLRDWEDEPLSVIAVARATGLACFRPFVPLERQLRISEPESQENANLTIARGEVRAEFLIPTIKSEPRLEGANPLPERNGALLRACHG